MASSRWLNVWTVAAVSIGPFAASAARAETTPGPGLSVRAGGVLLQAGTPYRGIGVNCFDAFARTLKDHQDTSYEAGPPDKQTSLCSSGSSAFKVTAPKLRKSSKFC
jgi:hypothetical protein